MLASVTFPPRHATARIAGWRPDVLLIPLSLALTFLPALAQAEPAALINEANAAEAKWDSKRALGLFLQADQERPNDPVILQKIARQYSDLVIDQTNDEARRKFASLALGYAERAVAIAPDNAVNVLSLAICHGKLALYSDTRAKVQYSRLVCEEAGRALALDPNYAWAHHVLGRWDYEVAQLGRTTRFFVGLVYGGLPPASCADAIQHLQRATELDPGELNHWLDLGFAYAAAGQPKEARSNWQHGLAMPDRGKDDGPAKKRAQEALARLN